MLDSLGKNKKAYIWMAVSALFILVSLVIKFGMGYENIVGAYSGYIGIILLFVGLYKRFMV
ncbi:hypothetical protein HYX09_01920 [Candidatus Woesearchaeota archaeon]|nr:hypothetical protein [Candidatus Woesearchaeota archaeon]MBI2661005.1 hypothetical protein [Candidatus Woesearchaeota archaeon]